MANSASRTLLMLTLVAVGGGLSFLGRLGIDWIIGIAPRWETEIERFGQLGLGMTIGALVVIPMLRIYGVFDARKDRAQSDKAVPESAIEAKDKIKKS